MVCPRSLSYAINAIGNRRGGSGGCYRDVAELSGLGAELEIEGLG